MEGEISLAKMLSVRIAWALFSLLNYAEHSGSRFTLLSWGMHTPFPWGIGHPHVLFSNSAHRFGVYLSLPSLFSVVSCPLPIFSPAAFSPIFVSEEKKISIGELTAISLDFVDFIGGWRWLESHAMLYFLLCSKIVFFP